MPKVKYVGPFDEVEIPDLGLVVKRGDTVDVPSEVRLGRDFEPVRATTKNKDKDS